MRYKINFTENLEIVPNNQQLVNSYIHKCLGVNNPYHDKPSNYCVSRLLGKNSKIINNGANINYPNGSYILVTSLDLEFLNKIITGIVNNPVFGFGMKLSGIDLLEENFYDGWNYFKTTNMGFILKRLDENHKQIGYHNLNDKDFASEVKKHIINKFSKINPNLDFSDFNVVINQHNSHKVKTIYCKNVKNVANICQINIFANKNIAKYIYNYGLGQSTGSGFGSIYTTKYHHLYI